MKQLIKKLIGNRLSHDSVNALHKVEAVLAALRYGFPARKLRLIGITGTNGKTSVAHYACQILQEAGKKTGMITTVAITINGKRTLNKTKMTTLDAFTLHKYLRQIADAGCEYAIVETTSHALDQNRVYGLYYEAVCFTNLTHEHLDYHKTMTDYQKAKERLFSHNPKVSVVNADDPAAPAFLEHPATQKFSYGIVDQLRPKAASVSPDIEANSLKLTSTKTSFHLKTPLGETDALIPLPGRFTVSNVLAAVGLALGQGIPLQQIKYSLARLEPVEGRLEPVSAGQPFSVIVDFAHTPDALQQVYSTIRPMVKGKLIAVLGSMGNRDKTKRPILGALAARYADLVIITDEDPGAEDPKQIIDEIADGVPRGRPAAPNSVENDRHGEGEWWWRVEDRREGIKKGLSLAHADDTVLITGKGGEHVMAVGTQLIPWNDVKVVKEILHHEYKKD